jgi:hypothetical protein
MFSVTMASQSTIKKVLLKKIVSVSPCNPLRPIPNLITCQSIPAARTPISVVIPFDLPKKREALMEETNVRRGKTDMDAR